MIENDGGDLTLARQLPLIGNPGEILAADLDGVPGLEIAVIRSIASQVSILRPDPTEWLVPIGVPAEVPDPSTIGVADLDQDGALELLAGRFSPGEIRQARAAGTGFTIDGQGTGPDGMSALAAGDLDGDGRLEIVTAGARGDEIGVLDDTLTLRSTTPAPTWPGDVVIHDLDGDGSRPEVIVPGNLADEVAIYEPTGAGPTLALVRRATFPTLRGPISTAPIDLDRDGVFELLVAEKDGFSIGIFGGPWDAPVHLGTLATGDGPTPLLTVDLDGDGRLDIVTVDAFSNQVRAWLAR